MKLDDEEFIRVIRATPLVAIDLIVQNELGEILLGRRCNRPALNYWFVPGGRIRKNERSAEALQRIGMSELRIEIPAGKLLGVFDHLYDDNYFGLPDMSTHYVTLAYQIDLKKSNFLVHDEQHAELKWWDMDSLLCSEEVHQNTKLYFDESDLNVFKCNCG
ncbi:MAG: GDP-mannose mannosyl hydrolase [Burkholderiaceae bacterium]